MPQETEDLLQVLVDGIPMEDWWNSSLRGLDKKIKQCMASLIIYTAWNLWRERNRCIFEAKAGPPSRAVALIKEEVHIRHQAFGGDELILVS